MAENKNPGRNNSKTTDQPSEKTNQDFNQKAPKPDDPGFKERKPKAEVENVATGGTQSAEAENRKQSKNVGTKK